MCVKQACSRTIQTSGANRFVRGAHHRRCAREGLIGVYDALSTVKLQGSVPLQLASFVASKIKCVAGQSGHIRN